MQNIFEFLQLLVQNLQKFVYLKLLWIVSIKSFIQGLQLG